MKNKFLPIIGITVILLAVIGLRTNSFSAQGLPYPNIPEEEENSPNACTQSIANEIYLMRTAWNENLKILTEQEKPTSEMVDDAFSDMRTYRCWLQYLCESVLVSGGYDYLNADNNERITNKFIEEESKGVPFGSHLTDVPGCVSGDKITIPGTKLKYMPYCATGAHATDRFGNAETNNLTCLNLIGLEFSDINNPDLAKTEVGKASSKLKETLHDQSSAFVGLVSALKKNSGDQMGVVLQSKLQSILTKLSDTEAHMTSLKENMERFDQKLACLAPTCD